MLTRPFLPVKSHVLLFFPYSSVPLATDAPSAASTSYRETAAHAVTGISEPDRGAAVAAKTVRNRNRTGTPLLNEAPALRNKTCVVLPVPVPRVADPVLTLSGVELWPQKAALPATTVQRRDLGTITNTNVLRALLTAVTCKSGWGRGC